MITIADVASKAGVSRNDPFTCTGGNCQNVAIQNLEAAELAHN